MIPANDTIAPRARLSRASSGPPVKQCITVRRGVPSRSRISKVSSQALREWMTSGRSRSFANWIWAANTSRCSAAASGRSDSRGPPPPRRRLAGGQAVQRFRRVHRSLRGGGLRRWRTHPRVRARSPPSAWTAQGRSRPTPCASRRQRWRRRPEQRHRDQGRCDSADRSRPRRISPRPAGPRRRPW